MSQPLAMTQLPVDEQESARSVMQPIRLGEDQSGANERRDHQSVPIGKDFIVEPGPRAAAARRKQRFAPSREPWLVRRICG
jgi:hypothetical protein